MIMPFPTSVIFVKLEPLSLKTTLTFDQNSLLSFKSLTLNFEKYCLFFSFLTLSAEILKRWVKKFFKRFFWIQGPSLNGKP